MSVFPNRKRLRYQGYDYSQPGGYFVTICTYQNTNLFGRIENDIMILNDFGMIAQQEWLKTALIRPEITLDEFIIMPNHIHGIIIINYAVRAHGDASKGADGCPPLHIPHPSDLTLSNPPLHIPHCQPKSLGSLIAGYKSSVTKQINIFRSSPGQRVWHRSYYDHIIRDNNDLDRIRAYIRHNPARRRSRA